MQIDKKVRCSRRKTRIRKRIFGATEVPRLSVKFSGRHIYAQCIDDEIGSTLVFLSTLGCAKSGQKLHANVAGATILGKVFGEMVISAGIRCVVFDRNGRRYHGCVMAFAEAARSAGLLF
ncbi:MAG: 50S ribosomal protein L18 [Puniceicoccales bacterium]|jgi:large subunit ribosomal protein L18|nr:50S ribosomal protein L18 [Puniceicoccales bacterium]